jgi:hypothetical protein
VESICCWLDARIVEPVTSFRVQLHAAVSSSFLLADLLCHLVPVLMPPMSVAFGETEDGDNFMPSCRAVLSMALALGVTSVKPGRLAIA